MEREATTVALYERMLRHHIRPIVGRLRLDAMKPAHIQDILTGAKNLSRTALNGERLGASTTRNVLILTQAVFEWGVSMEFISRNPARNIRPPKVEHRESPNVDPESIRRILEGVIGTALETIIPFALATGLRRAELCALQWRDVDFDRAMVSVRRAAAIINGKVIIKSPKTRKSTRTDALPAFIVAMLQKHRIEQAKRHLALGLGRPAGEQWVFDRADGSGWNPNRLSQEFSRIVRRKGLPRVRLHDQRHGYASLSFAAGVPLKVVSESLGHSGIGVTSQLYVHLMDESKREKATRLEAYFETVLAPDAEKLRRSS